MASWYRIEFFSSDKFEYFYFGFTQLIIIFEDCSRNQSASYFPIASISFLPLWPQASLSSKFCFIFDIFYSVSYSKPQVYEGQFKPSLILFPSSKPTGPLNCRSLRTSPCAQAAMVKTGPGGSGDENSLHCAILNIRCSINYTRRDNSLDFELFFSILDHFCPNYSSETTSFYRT